MMRIILVVFICLPITVLSSLCDNPEIPEHLQNGEKKCCVLIHCPKGDQPVICEKESLNATCQPCPNGTYSDESLPSSLNDGGSMPKCKSHGQCTGSDRFIKMIGTRTSNLICVCKNGLYLGRNDKCVNDKCPPGESFSSNSENCQRCFNGTFKNSTSNDQCLNCTTCDPGNDEQSCNSTHDAICGSDNEHKSLKKNSEDYCGSVCCIVLWCLIAAIIIALIIVVAVCCRKKLKQYCCCKKNSGSNEPNPSNVRPIPSAEEQPLTDHVTPSEVSEVSIGVTSA